MAYYNGTANDMAAVRTALVSACVSEGWAWNSVTEVLSKGVMFLRMQVVTGYLRLLGRSSAAAGDMSHVVQIGPFTGRASDPLPPLVYPISYELFLFGEEVYCVINYSVDCYQWCAWGKSAIQGLPGTGMWVGASAANARTSYQYGIYLGKYIGGSEGGAGSYFCPALFWSTQSAPEESRVHSDLDGQGWWMAQTVNGSTVGIAAAGPLIGLLPNLWNSEAVLLPIRAYKVRPSSKISLTADLTNSRYTRVDNYAPGEIINIGSDRWKIFPWFRKNSSQRDAGGDVSSHTGTFGWAIRYEGP